MRLARADSGLRARATHPAGEDAGGADADARNHRARLSDSNPAPHTATTQAAARHLKEGGSVINIGSSITSMTPPTMAVYVGSKAAVESITKVLSKEVGPKGIRVNCVMPGTTETEMFRSHLGGNVETPV
jgi:3-oxoacyl-[acyl-carrier protein] reductase